MGSRKAVWRLMKRQTFGEALLHFGDGVNVFSGVAGSDELANIGFAGAILFNACGIIEKDFIEVHGSSRVVGMELGSDACWLSS